MAYLILALLLLTSSEALATEDSLRRYSPYDFLELFEDLYSTPEQAEEALDHFDVLSFGEDLLREDLSALPGISSATAFRIGNSDTLNWRQVNDGLTSRQSQILNGLIGRDPKYLWASRSRVQIDPRAREEKGYNDGRTLGTPYKLYDRLLLSQYGLSAGLLQAKDAGEENAFDLVRGYFQLHERQAIAGTLTLEHAIIGDYSLGFGSGLVFSAGGMQGKSSEVIDAVEPNARGVKGYLSSSIGSGFRGAAATMSLGGLHSTMFYSNRSYDARSDSGVITSLSLDGYHRTESESAKIDIAKSRLLGADMSYDHLGASYHLQLGVTGYNEVFAMPVKTGGFAYNFSGRSLSMLSQHGAFTDSSLAINYELAWSKQESADALGGVVSIVLERSKQLQFSLNGRYLPHDLVSRHGGTFGESTDDAQNERGLYLGARFSPRNDLTFAAYADIANTFVPPYLAQNNFKTTDFLLHAEYELSGSMRLTSRSRWKRKSDEERLEVGRVLGSRDQFNTRLEHEWDPNENLRLRTRGEIVTVGYNNFTNARTESGFLISSSARMKLWDAVSPDIRVTWFNCPTYDSRLYVYENDLQGASGLTMLYGAGMRYSLLVAVDVLEGARVAAKYGITMYSKEREFGSGITERSGKTSSKLGFQIDLQF
jgi:hypothetical protein